jgi:hypothetical protein
MVPGINLSRLLPVGNGFFQSFQPFENVEFQRWAEGVIQQGYGYADTRFDHVMKKRFEQLEKQAQTEKRGLWKNVQPKQWPEWRQDKK